MTTRPPELKPPPRGARGRTETLTRTGPGTEAGRLLRHYWVPALLSSELAVQGPPLRLTLLGERLVAFRDGSGKVGVVEERCAHRRASLYFGRNEGPSAKDGTFGLRCAYHGWCYDTSGRCIDIPNEPEDSRFKDHIRLISYPVAERADIIWVYMGAEASPPGLPELEWTLVPEGHRYVSRRVQHCNYLQAMEGGLDSSHVSFLHSDAPLWNPPWTHQSGGSRRHLRRGAPKFFVEPTDYGLLIAARRHADEDSYYWRITQWLMPWYTLVPRDDEEPIGAHAWVPATDETCTVWSINYVPERHLRREERDFYHGGGGIHAETIPGTCEPIRNQDNEYMVDRALQRSGASLSGIAGIAMQDTAMQESMGPVVDRNGEHLGSADIGIVAARRRLLAEVDAIDQDGYRPSGLDPAGHRVRSASITLPIDTSWVEATAASRMVPPPSRLVDAAPNKPSALAEALQSSAVHP